MLGDNIAERLLALANVTVQITKQLPQDIAGRHIAGQLLRAGTAPPAHYEEARAAESRADFIHKVSIAAKEVRETIYWLRLVKASSLVEMPLDSLIEEAGELRAILQACVRTAKAGTGRKKAALG